ncbi:MAG: hypothetical protein VB120_03475 [Lachnospiraceae bacterium]|nr:hypothetical protein [Lachnospiraceae bacterium]
MELNLILGIIGCVVLLCIVYYRTYKKKKKDSSCSSSGCKTCFYAKTPSYIKERYPKPNKEENKEEN